MGWSNVAKELVLFLVPLVLWTQFNIVRERFSSIKNREKRLNFFCYFSFLFSSVPIQTGRQEKIIGILAN